MNYPVSGRQADNERDRGQLWALFALIVYAPLPLASNRPWALALLGLLVAGLLLWNIWRPGGRQAAYVWQSARTPLILFGLWMSLLALQLVPMPQLWLDALDQRTLTGFAAQDMSAGPISIDPYSTRLYLAKACILTSVFWLVVVLVNSRRRIEWLAKIVVFSGLLQALIGVVLMAGGTIFTMFFVELSNPRAHGTFVSPNNLAGHLELTLAVGIGLMIAKLDGRSAAGWRQRLHGWLAVLLSEKLLLRLSLIIMVIGLVASRSRMGNAAFFASLLTTGLFTIIFARQATRKAHEKHATNTQRATIIFITSLIVLDIVIIGGVVGIEKVVQRIEYTNLETQARDAPVNANGQAQQVHYREESVEERSEAARYAIQIARDFPWVGTGGGTFHLAFPHYQPPELHRGFWDHTHNDFVEFASETGLLGLLLLALLAADSAWRSVKLLVRSHDQLARGMAFASLMGLTSLLIHGAVDFNLQIPANALLFLILLSQPYLQTMLKR